MKKVIVQLALKSHHFSDSFRVPETPISGYPISGYPTSSLFPLSKSNVNHSTPLMLLLLNELQKTNSIQGYIFPSKVETFP